MSSSFSIITADTITKIVDSNRYNIYDAVKTAYIRHGRSHTSNLPSYFLKFPDKEKARIIALPALITENPRIAGIKWISSNPDNLDIGLKRASAVIILNDYETGYPIACLEGGAISALRTVYSAILVSDLLDKDKKTISIIGTGYISEQFIRAFCLQNWSVSTIKLFDLNIQASIKLKEIISKVSSIKVEIAKNLKDSITESNLIFFSTTSSIPYITDLSWFRHNPVVLHISLRDLSPEVLLASNNIVDDILHVVSANTSPHLAEQISTSTAFINCTVSQLIDGYNQFDDRPIIFSPMGMGILDLVVASYIYNEAKQNNFTIEISNFFATK